MIGTAGAVLAGATVAATQGWRARDRFREHDAWRRLDAAPSTVALPTAAELDAFPEPARRYLRFAIRPGARLSRRAVVSMEGTLALGTRAAPREMPMQATQLLALPDGFVWRVRAGSRWLPMAGSDGLAPGHSWTRIWLLGAVPVVRAGGTPDHLRSAFGRAVAEAVLWTPCALLPRPGVTWEAAGPDIARVTVASQGLVQSVDARLAPNGRPECICLQRWSDANPDRRFRLQPFGGPVRDFREVEGQRVAFDVEAGHFFGTPAYFPFYRARVRSVRFT